jgi:hypothetical protein
MFRFLLAVALFFIIANPALFKLTGKMFGRMIASPEGLPTQAGVLLHALVFVIAGRLVGRFSRYADEPEMYEEEEKYEEEYADEPAEMYEDEYAEETSEYTLTPGAY